MERNNISALSSLSIQPTNIDPETQQALYQKGRTSGEIFKATPSQNSEIKSTRSNANLTELKLPSTKYKQQC